ncbi:ABC transporter permease [Nodularia spumigena]|uniref:ABC transporter permease n=1 Tax=Nodularia spumigena UHCC 0060 TaxID=3110300 RepID=A0ABU5UW32_NODSP|nr:ABC transporter permease [Nodularia spumigena]MEA5527762.1 ABC transporter permease [Nodularia spumigena UHCC 0143]MEA5610508.1 ABC transporter permease [Nodularia spumigena UHCC 0060]MEA5616164.1 ABC transporter permease [Nodularia spumigena UHCC 0040]
MRKPSTISKRVVYTSESRIRHPLQLFREMGRDLLASRELAWRLLVRDISAQYRQSLFGVLWAFLPPIITATGLLVARNAGAVNIGETEIPYPAYVMFSMALWQTFVESLNGPIGAVGAAKPMLAKINFPKEAIILAKLGEVFFNFGIKLILILGLFIWFQIPVTWSALLAPVALIHLVILGTGIGLLLAPIGALYGDIAKAIPLIVSPWLLLTPVIYPTPKEGLFATIVNLNPVTPLLVTTRDLATSGLVTNPTGFWVVSGLAFGLLLIAWILYRLAMPFIVERMSS